MLITTLVTSQNKLSEKWPWNGEFLRLFLLLPCVVGITATLATFPFAGVQALWLLTAILVGLVQDLSRREERQRIRKRSEPQSEWDASALREVAAPVAHADLRALRHDRMGHG